MNKVNTSKLNKKLLVILVFFAACYAINFVQNIYIKAKAEQKFGKEVCWVGYQDGAGRLSILKNFTTTYSYWGTLWRQEILDHDHFFGRPIHFGVVNKDILYGWSYKDLAFYPITADHLFVTGKNEVIQACSAK